ncbi:hypothetical protein AX15_002963 [Amanita polypyramis BW_CC]|nr:hypothetical protein AX15_002963 [Amanita polypyramis BW_CC]
MPIEIVQKIFLHCLPNDEYTRPDRRSAPLLLTQVCSSWRDVALKTPRLWNSLWIQLSRSNVDRRLNTMATWLQRSAACTLSLYAQVQSTGLDPVHLFFLLLEAYRPRWKDLRLVLPLNWARLAIRILSRATPLLEVFRIRVAKSQDSFLQALQTSFILTDTLAPRLRHLSWGITGLQRLPCLPRLSQLEELDIDYELSASECVGILRECHNLVSCEFWKITDISNSFNTKFPVTLSKLRYISLHSTVGAGVLLDFLTLPALVRLKIAFIGSAGGQNLWSQSGFNNFVARSACSLRDLIMQDVLSSEGDLIQCLKYVSTSLIELVLLDTKGLFIMRDRTLTFLTARNDFDNNICPRLEVLRFGRSLLATDGLLADMIESRCKSDRVTPLRSINPYLSIVDHPEDIRRLAVLRSSGVLRC